MSKYCYVRGVVTLALTILHIAAFRRTASAQRPSDTAVVAPAGSSVQHIDRSRSTGAVVYTLDSTEIMSSGARTLSGVLQARVPALSVFQSGGVAGQGAQIRSRGTRSFAISTEPIVVVDGIRVDAKQDATLLPVDVGTSRLDDISPEDVARIEVLPGASAAGAYGPGAAGGALLITTKRGAEQGIHLSSRAQSGVGVITTSFPTNYRLQGTLPTGESAHCVLLTVASGQCTPTRLDSWNPLRNASPFRAARSAGGALAVDGAVRRTTARLGLTADRTLGVTSDDDADRVGARASITQRVAESIEITGVGGYVRTSAALPPRGNHLSASNVIARGLYGSGVRDTLDGYLPAFGWMSARETARHWVGGASLQWDAFRWLRVSGVYGVDHLVERDNLTGGQVNLSPFIQEALFSHDLASAAFSARSADWSVGHSSLVTRTIVGYDQLRSTLSASNAQAFGAQSPPLFLTAGMGMRSRVGASTLRQELSWSDRLQMGGGLRWERWSPYSAPKPGRLLKSADVSWLAGRKGRLDSLRFRAAYGEAGNWSAGEPRTIAMPNFGIGGPPDPSLFAGQERIRELEFGADFGFAHRATVSVTGYRTDASSLYAFQIPMSQSADGNAGALRNEGIELASRVRIASTNWLRWDATIRASVLRDRVRSIGSAFGYIPVGYGILRPGSPVNAYYSHAYTYTDANHDGIIGQNEIQAVSFEPVVLGSSLPNREASLLSAWTLSRGLTLSGLLDYRGGQKLANLNEAFRCIYYGNCRAVSDRTASLADQAQADVGFITNAPYVEGASFAKLREVSLRWAVPPRLATWVGGPATVTIAGRNLATWTRYRGLDPELNEQSLNMLPRVDLAETPLPREVLIRFDLVH